MKNLNFLAVTGCGLLAVFLISFTAACSRQSGAADAPVMQADSGGLQSVGTVDKTENGTADAGQAADDSGASVQDSVSHESVGQAQEATVKPGRTPKARQTESRTQDRRWTAAGRKPETQARCPEMMAEKPEMKVSYPEMAAQKPETQARYPEMTTGNPPVKIRYQEITVERL